MRTNRIAVGLLVLVTACARASTPGEAAPADRVEPPVMLTRGSFPELEVPLPANAANRPTVDIRIEVGIDEEGQPDMKTLKIVGIVTSDNRIAIERWLNAATFRPASRNGQAVPGVYKTRLQARVVVVRRNLD